MSSATVRRAGCGMDSTTSPTHLPSVAGRPASGRGSMISAGVWCNTRNMGAGRPAAPPHPFQTALTPPGLETPDFLTTKFKNESKRFATFAFPVSSVQDAAEETAHHGHPGHLEHAIVSVRDDLCGSLTSCAPFPG